MMKIQTVWAVWWSATGNTRTVAEAVADGLAKELELPLRRYDFTLPGSREKQLSFGQTDLVVVALPTYAGKLPNKILPWVQAHLEGNGALAVPVVTFGNRSFDNSLAELTAELEAHGFHTVSAAAFVGRHAFTDRLAPGRPDREDLAAARDFACRTAEKVKGLTAVPAPVAVPGDPQAPYYVPKGPDGAPAKFLKAKPVTDPERCDGCGLCVTLCPMGAIDPLDVTQVPGTCIKCHACVRGCPSGAKFFDDPAFLSHRAMLEEHFTRPAQPEFYL